MNLYKILTTIFILLSVGIAVYIGYILVSNSKETLKLEFFSEDSARYVNYYFKREDYKYKFKGEKFVMEKTDVGSVEFKRDDLLNSFLTNWSTFDNRVYPNEECDYLRISVPVGIKDVTQGGLTFSCVSSYINDKLNNNVK